MLGAREVTAESSGQRLQTARGLLHTCEQALELTRRLHREIIEIRTWEQRSGTVTPLGYSLGISHGDIEIAANRLGGLRNELQQMVRLLEQQVHENDR